MAAPATGARLGPYEILSPLQTGGMTITTKGTNQQGQPTSSSQVWEKR